MSRIRRPVWQPKPEDYMKVFREQNPWHVTGEVPESLAFRTERELAKRLWCRLATNRPRRYQLILGPRRVGKTTCLYQSVRSLLREGIDPMRLWWLRLDHPLLMEVDLGSLVRSVIKMSQADEQQPTFLFLDELTYAKNWDKWLKTFYDENWPVQIAGSSSATALLRDKRTESGVGRWEEQYLAPYLIGGFLALLGRQVPAISGDNLSEVVDQLFSDPPSPAGLSEIRRRLILVGGFPELILDDESRQDNLADGLFRSQRILRTDAIERTIYRDIPQAYGVDNPSSLERVLYTLAGQIAQIFSPSNICSDLGVSKPTLEKYVVYLEQSFLIFTLQNFSGSEPKRQKRGRKLFFVDTALRNAALQRGLSPLDDHAEMGLLLENIVASHLHALSQQTQVRLFHWREKKYEVDLVYDHPEAPMAFEVTSSARHDRESLYQFMETFPRFKGRCFVVGPKEQLILPADSWDQVGSLPVDSLLIACSQLTESFLRRNLDI